MIRVQREDFDAGEEMRQLSRGRRDVGALATFLGLVRDESDSLASLTLEHYPGMTERQLAAVEAEARRRWTLAEVVIIHRYGRLIPGDNIVFVGVLAGHRAEAFAACEFLMDWLKTKAPFWKHEDGGDGWVAAKAEDEERTLRWG